MSEIEITPRVLQILDYKCVKSKVCFTCCQFFYCCRESTPALERRSPDCPPAYHQAGLWAAFAAVGEKKKNHMEMRHEGCYATKQ